MEDDPRDQAEAVCSSFILRGSEDSNKGLKLSDSDSVLVRDDGRTVNSIVF